MKIHKRYKVGLKKRWTLRPFSIRRWTGNISLIEFNPEILALALYGNSSREYKEWKAAYEAKE